MKAKFFLFLTFLYLTNCTLFSCENIRNNKIETACTQIFIMSYLKVEGQVLDTFYTIRLSTNDTIWGENYGENSYEVLNDRYQDALEGQKDSFHFVGIVADSIVVLEPYVFEADFCHINKVSGKSKIQL